MSIKFLNYFSINILSPGLKCISILLLILPLFSFSQTVTDKIKLNQAGFYPGAPKVAVVTGDVVSNDFYIATTNLRDTVFRGKLSEEKQSAYSSTKTRIAVFSSFTGKGSYVVCIPGIGTSYVFDINNDVYQNVGISTLKGFYYQRVSMPLEE